MEEKLHNFLTQYNETIRGSGMDMVFFNDAMTNLIKVLDKFDTDLYLCHFVMA